jgi:hypothetical protein
MTYLIYLERRWPDSPAFQDIARRWCEDQSRLLLELVWRGYDSLVSQDLNVVAFSATDEAKEESLNYLLAIHIDQSKNGDEPFCVIHQPPEQTKRKCGRGRSPQPDIGFALYNCSRAVWPIEAKVLSHDEDIRPYIAEVRSNFITCRYATFSSEGAIVGYLLQGEPERTFAALGISLEQALIPHPYFPDRPQRMTVHLRKEVPHPHSPRDFVCHHLLFSIPIATN